MLREARSVSVVQVELMDSRLSGLRYVEQFLNDVQQVCFLSPLPFTQCSFLFGAAKHVGLQGHFVNELFMGAA